MKAALSCDLNFSPFDFQASAVVIVAVVMAAVVVVSVPAVVSVPSAVMTAIVVVVVVVTPVAVLSENTRPARQDEHEREKRAEFLHLRMLLQGAVGATCV
jgi:hypothetical protein